LLSYLWFLVFNYLDQDFLFQFIYWICHFFCSHKFLSFLFLLKSTITFWCVIISYFGLYVVLVIVSSFSPFLKFLFFIILILLWGIDAFVLYSYIVSYSLLFSFNLGVNHGWCDLYVFGPGLSWFKGFEYIVLPVILWPNLGYLDVL